METTKEQNRALCERYPFLIPRNAWSGRRITDGAGFWPGSPDSEPEYDYEYTELDAMPDGWRIAFGEQLCEELRDNLVNCGRLDDFYFTQIKEKYGMLRMYHNGLDRDGDRILNKYEALSKKTCILCGKPATRITLGWISPYCDECLPGGERSVPIEQTDGAEAEDGEEQERAGSEASDG